MRVPAALMRPVPLFLSLAPTLTTSPTTSLPIDTGQWKQRIGARLSLVGGCCSGARCVAGTPSAKKVRTSAQTPSPEANPSIEHALSVNLAVDVCNTCG